MADEQSSGPTPESVEGKTSDEILKMIQVEQGQAPAPETEPEAPPAESPEEPAEVPADDEQGKSDQPEEGSSPSGDTPAPAEDAGKAALGDDEWMKKKGFKSPQDMAKALRNLERELSRRSKPQPVVRTEQPVQMPSQPIQYPPTSIEAIAAHYNVPPEDFQRVVQIVNDAAEIKLRMQMQPFVQELTKLRKEVSRESEFASLESDPLFHNPEVLKEMHQVMEENPSILEIEPEPYKHAFKEAQLRLFRRSAEGSIGDNGKPTGSGNEPKRTPPPSGKGSVTATRTVPIKPASAMMTPDKFQRLPSKDMARFLKSQGLKLDKD